MRKIPIEEWEGIEYQVMNDKHYPCSKCIGQGALCRSLARKVNCEYDINAIAKRHVTIAEYKAYKEGLK